jgi:hypothetical protein
MLEASRTMKLATQNRDVIRRADNQIREAERSLQYFENMLRDLTSKKSSGSDTASIASSNSSVPTISSGYSQNRRLPPTPGNGYGTPNPSTSSLMQPEPQKAKQYSNLGMLLHLLSLACPHPASDLLKAETPYTPAKISRMLHQLEYKLQVEMQYKRGISQMAMLYQQEGDKKSRQDAESKRVENEKKIQLLQSALKRYKNLHVVEVNEDEEG